MATARKPSVKTPVALAAAKAAAAAGKSRTRNLSKPAAKPASRPAAKTAVAPATKSAVKPVKALAKSSAAVAPVKAQAKPAAPVTASAPKAEAAKTKQPKADKAVKAAAEEKARKPKLVRDSFTIPKNEYATIEELKARGAKLGRPAKKSEVLRAGIKLLATLSDAALVAALAQVPAIKTGRPGKN